MKQYQFITCCVYCLSILSRAQVSFISYMGKEWWGGGGVNLNVQMPGGNGSDGFMGKVHDYF